jgi:hypothetical protein
MELSSPTRLLLSVVDLVHSYRNFHADPPSYPPSPNHFQLDELSPEPHSHVQEGRYQTSPGFNEEFYLQDSNNVGTSPQFEDAPPGRTSFDGFGSFHPRTLDVNLEFEGTGEQYSTLITRCSIYPVTKTHISPNRPTLRPTVTLPSTQTLPGMSGSSQTT